jgi:hypothetical protein
MSMADAAVMVEPPWTPSTTGKFPLSDLHPLFNAISVPRSDPIMIILPIHSNLLPDKRLSTF